jgi:dihydrofolate reductase
MCEERKKWITLLVAWDENKLIGKGIGELPWKCSRDLKLFQERTAGQTIIMGLNTYNGLPQKPLKGRVNIVVTPEFLEVPAVLPLNTVLMPACGVRDAIDLARYHYPLNETFICGGASIYKQALEQDLVDRILVSVIPGSHDGDVYFPEFAGIWTRCVVEEYNEFYVEEWMKDQK